MTATVTSSLSTRLERGRPVSVADLRNRAD